MFLSHGVDDKYFCRSFFPEEKKDYTRNQTSWTMLYKKKCNMSTGEEIILYDRLKKNNMFIYKPFGLVQMAVKDLEYFRNEMIRLHKANELFDDEIVDLMGFVNTIITHITNGNQNEERLVNIMGGTVIETESEKLIRKGSEAGGAKQIIEMGQEFGLDDAAILERLQGKLGLSLEKATAYLEQYGKALA